MDWLKKFFHVYIEKQTYLNLLYLLLAFPLGLAYFIFLVTGLSLGAGLLIIWIGILILLVVYAVWYGLLAFERIQAIYLLNEAIPPMIKQDLSGKSLWQKFTATFTNSVTWKGLLFLFLKFPLGLISFIVLTTFGSASAAMMAVPLLYNRYQPEISLTFENQPFNSFWMMDTLPEAMSIFIIGFLVLTLSLHLFNLLAKMSGKIAYALLGDFSKPAESTVPIAAEPSPVANEPLTTESSLVEK